MARGIVGFVFSIAGRAGLPDQTAQVAGPWSLIASVAIGTGGSPAPSPEEEP